MYKHLIYILLLFCISCKPETTDIWVKIEVSQYNKTASKNAQIYESITLDTLDFSDGGWSIGNGFYDKYGDRMQAGNMKAWVYPYDIDLKGNDLEVNTAYLFIDGDVYDNGVLQSIVVLQSQGRIKYANNLSKIKNR